MNEVNVQALANQATALQSARSGTGEIRYTSVDLLDAAGAPTGLLAPGSTLVVRAAYRGEQRDRAAGVPGRHHRRRHRARHHDGHVAARATCRTRSVGAGTIECRFPRLPLRPRQYILRLSITDSYQLASYDVVTAGPRFAVSGHGSGVDGLADEEDGLVSLPFEFAHHAADVAGVPHA